MSNALRPLHQRIIVIVAAAVLGFLMVGAVLDAASNAISLISPRVTYLGTAAFLGVALAAEALLRRHPIRWVVNGQATNIRRLQAIPLATLLGMVLLLWVPRIFEIRSPPAPPSDILDDESRALISASRLNNLPASAFETLATSVAITVSPGVIRKGQAARLTWSTTNAVSVLIIPSIGYVPADGSVNVRPKESTTYQIGGTNPSGLMSFATVRVEVVP